MKLLLIDDERPARAELKYVLSEVLPEAEFYEADCAEKAKELLNEILFNVVFLDINLGEVSGIMLASTMKEQQKDTAVVFVTAYQEYAVKAFELEAVDYVLKPFDIERIKKTIHHLEELHYLEEKTEHQKDFWGEELDKLPVHTADKIKLIDYKEIVFIEYNNRTSVIHTLKGSYAENYTMSALEERLEKKEFFRIHKSFLVNLKYMDELVLGVNNCYGMRMKQFPKDVLPISRGQMKHLKMILDI